MFKRIVHFLGVSLLFFLCGCACVDPFEPLNRKIFTFNLTLDRALLRPVARAYERIVPPPVICCIGHFFDNLDDLTNIANNTLQCKFYDAWSDCWRFAFNTTFGLLGLFDVATCAGLCKHHQDFGLTLARYGIVNSPYLMVPLFGPATIRDSIGWAVDWRYLSIWSYLEPDSVRYSLYGLRLIHKRMELLAADKLIDDSLDPYLFVRDAYLQKRAADIRCICPPGIAEPLPCDNKAAAKLPSGEDTFVPEETNSAKASKAVKGAPKTSTTTGGSDDPFVDA